MVVKSVRGRRRYIVYMVPPDTDRGAITVAISSLTDCNPQLKVITCFGGKSVIRTTPEGIMALNEIMKGSFEGCESLTTSGTLRTVRDRFPELKVPRQRKR